MPKVCSIHSGDQKGGGKPAILFGELVTDSGLRGDRHAGRDPLRQNRLLGPHALELALALDDAGLTVIGILLG